MKRTLIIILTLTLVTVFSIQLTGCSGESNKEYVKEAHIERIFFETDKFVGKYVKIGGQVMEVKKDGEEVSVTCFMNPEEGRGIFIAHMKTDEKFAEMDYIKVEGKIEGTESSESESSPVNIVADKIEKSTYQDVIDPALETKKVDITKNQHDIKFTLSKVEYAKKETRIYVKVKNDSKYDVEVYSGHAVIIQGGKEIIPEINYASDYPDIQDVPAGTTKKGIISYKPLDSKKGAKLKVGVFSDVDSLDMILKEFEVEF